MSRKQVEGNMSGDGQVVLVTDDEEDIRLICGMNLEVEGFTVAEAPDGEVALRLAREGCDLILLDLMMPVKDGWETLEALKSDEQLASIPVIVLTGKVQAADQLRAYREGAVGFVTKPFRPSELAETVQGILGSSPDELEEGRRETIARLEELAGE